MSTLDRMQELAGLLGEHGYDPYDLLILDAVITAVAGDEPVPDVPENLQARMLEIGALLDEHGWPAAEVHALTREYLHGALITEGPSLS